MKITVLQNQIIWLDIEKNIQEAESMLKENSGSDLYVLSEMWSTGFVTEPSKIAEGTTQEDNTALRWMLDAAKRYECAIAGSMTIKEGTTYRNRLFFVHPDGCIDYYDKHHLFGSGGENNHYTAGNKRVIAKYKGIRFLLNTCYDLRFPIWQRNFNDYDVLLMVANWPESRKTAWNTLLRARAIENQCFVVGCNRIGNDSVSIYAGDSAIIDALGNNLANSVNKTKEAITATIDMNELSIFRKKFPVLQEADKIEII
jgi:omega-amidase